MKLVKYISLTFVLSLVNTSFVSSCAKERKIDRVADTDNNRYKKSMFTIGSNNPTSTQLQLMGNSPLKWMSKVTLVKASGTGGVGFIGVQTEPRVGYFEFERDKLRFYDSLTIYPQPSSTERRNIYSWDVKHSEYRLAESDGQVTNREEEDPYLNWDQKTYAKIDFDKLDSIVDFADQQCWKEAGKRVLEGTKIVSENHIAFTLAVDYELKDDCLTAHRYFTNETKTTVHYRYSFKPLDQITHADYQPYKYTSETDPLNQKYGYFQTTLEKLNENNRIENSFLMNRWALGKKHTIYFDADFPQEYKTFYHNDESGVYECKGKSIDVIGTGIIDRTNQLFECNDLDTRFEIIDVPNDVSFGDVGASFIKIVPEIDENGPFGYGPSDANPLSGEIVSSNTVIWTGGVKYYLQIINDELQRDQTRFQFSNLYKKMRDILNSDEEIPADQLASGAYMQKWLASATALKNSEAGKIFDFLIPEYTFGLQGNSFSNHNPYEVQNLVSDNVNANSNSEFESGLDNAFFKFHGDSDIVDLLSRPNRNAWGATIHKARQYLGQDFKEMLAQPEKYKACVITLEDALAGAKNGLIDGKSPTQILSTMLYRVGIHEFGHNLGLRHNFYGTVDAKNFHKPIPGVDLEGKPIMETYTDAKGKTLTRQRTYEQTSSSVMDYKDLTDEINDRENWEAYDEAALTYAYSDGTVDLSKINKTTYLYCTDEHTIFNALCNHYDLGSTPSEIALSLIKNYEARYWIRNYRFGRAYWSTESYPNTIGNDMFKLKRFLKFYEDTYGETDIKKKLTNSKWANLSEDDYVEFNRLIAQDQKQAMALVAAFYSSVISQSASDRPWTDVYDDFTGALMRKGIFWDKLYAMYFLMGDDGFSYNVNNGVSPASYLRYLQDADIGPTINKVIENTVTSRADMEEGFSSFGRSLFALNSFNYINRQDATLLHKVRYACYRPESLEGALGVNPSQFRKTPDSQPQLLDTVTLTLDSSKATNPDPYFSNSKDKVGIVRIGENYYVASEVKNTYAFDLIKNIENADTSVVTEKLEILEFYNMFYLMTESRVPECR